MSKPKQQSARAQLDLDLRYYCLDQGIKSQKALALNLRQEDGRRYTSASTLYAVKAGDQGSRQLARELLRVTGKELVCVECGWVPCKPWLHRPQLASSRLEQHFLDHLQGAQDD